MTTKPFVTGVLILIMGFTLSFSLPLHAGDKNSYTVLGHVVAINSIDYVHSTVTFTVMTNYPFPYAAFPQFLCDSASDPTCYNVIDQVGSCVEIKGPLRGDSVSGYLFRSASYSLSAVCTP